MLEYIGLSQYVEPFLEEGYDDMELWLRMDRYY
jgi:hypothetical protein